MDTNHTRFLDAMGRGMLIRVRFHEAQYGHVVEHTCAPVHFGPEPGSSPDADPRYWMWDYADQTGTNPMDVPPEDIVSVLVLDRAFDPAGFTQSPRTVAVSRTPQGTCTPATA